MWKNFLGRKQGSASDESVQQRQSGLLGFTDLDMLASIATCLSSCHSQVKSCVVPLATVK